MNLPNSRKLLHWGLMISMTTFLYGYPVLAENIDPNNLGLKYAYGENVGWINFKPSQGPGVTVTSSAVTGYVWATVETDAKPTPLYPLKYG